MSTTSPTFITPTVLDEAFLFVMGASVKKMNNPIGEFGTGLKYAIAVTLRIGGEIGIETQDNIYAFEIENQSLRGEDHSMIYCVRTDKKTSTSVRTRMPMTADYGKNWLPWMVLRELWSNTMDEGGTVHTGRASVAKINLVEGGISQDTPTEYTRIIVTHPDIYDAWLTRDKYFLNKERTPILVHGSPYAIEFYSGSSNNFFYRSINVSRNYDTKFAFTYNLINKMTLTEDRSLDHLAINHAIMYAISTCKDPGILSTFFEACNDEKSYEHTLPFASWNIAAECCDEYAKAAIKAVKDMPTLPTALKSQVFDYLSDIDPDQVFKPVILSDMQQTRLDRCMAILVESNIRIDKYTIHPTNDTKAIAHANTRHDRIVLNVSLSLDCEPNWKRETCGALIEMYIQLKYGVMSKTQEMNNKYNNMIFDLITSDEKERA